MSSLKQIEANRRNALKSTGPATLEGKRRSRCNAIRHGLTAETVIAGPEDPDDYKAFEAAVTADYDADTAVERELVLRLASVLWRLRRATGIETTLFETVTGESGEDSRDYSPLSIVGEANPLEHDQFSRAAAQEPQPIATNKRILDARYDIGHRFLRLAALPTFPLDRLSRYEYMLWRQARQITLTLDSLRYRRRLPSPARPPFSFRRNCFDEFK